MKIKFGEDVSFGDLAKGLLNSWHDVDFSLHARVQLRQIYADPDISVCFWNSNNRSTPVCRCVDRLDDIVDNHLVEFHLYLLQKRNKNTSRNCLAKWLSIVLEFNVLFPLKLSQSPEELRVLNLYISF